MLSFTCPKITYAQNATTFKIVTAISKELINGKWTEHWRLEGSLWKNEIINIDEEGKIITISMHHKILLINIDKININGLTTEYTGNSQNVKCFAAKELTPLDKNKDAVLYIEFSKVKYYYSVRYSSQ